MATFLTLLFLPAIYAFWFRNSLGARAAPAMVAPHAVDFAAGFAAPAE